MTDTVNQTPAQWAVRWHGVVAAALLVFAVPVFHLVWHGALGREVPPIVTRSQVSKPQPTFRNIANGNWMVRSERHLRESSPIVWWLRGSWNEAMLRCGIVQNRFVHLGRDDWLFRSTTLDTNIDGFRRAASARRAFYVRLREAVRAAGAELVISVVPDKSRVYPEHAFSDGAIPASKAPVYAEALEELRELGIPTPDLIAALAAARAANPTQPLFYQRDTHWRAEGALSAAQALAGVIEGLPNAAEVGPRLPAELGARSTFTALGDLVSLLGLLTHEAPLADGRTISKPASLLTSSLVESRDNYAAVLRPNGRSMPPLVEVADAAVLLIGTSFSNANGAQALALALGRQVRAVIDFDDTGMLSLAQVADELRVGTKARVVIWEVVERGLVRVDWENAAF